MTYVVIRYGEDKQLLFNPNCQAHLLLDDIKKRCNYPKEIEIDLSDEQGNLKNIAQRKVIYADQVLSVNREKLVLIQVKRNKTTSAEMSANATVPDGQEDAVEYIPLLHNADIINSKFTARLSNRDLPSSRSQSRAQKSRDKKKIGGRNGEPLTALANRPDPTIPPSSASKRVNGSRGKQSATQRKPKSRGKQR